MGLQHPEKTCFSLLQQQLLLPGIRKPEKILCPAVLNEKRKGFLKLNPHHPAQSHIIPDVMLVHIPEHPCGLEILQLFCSVIVTGTAPGSLVRHKKECRITIFMIGRYQLAGETAFCLPCEINPFLLQSPFSGDIQLRQYRDAIL